MIEEYAAELIGGSLLLLFGWAFRNWAGTIKESIREILDMLRSLSREFHNHVVTTENRVTKVEEKIANVEKMQDIKYDN